MVAIRENRDYMNDELSEINAPGLPHQHSAHSIYQAALLALRRRLSLFVWQGFFEPLVPISFSNDTLTIAAPTSFHRDWVQDHYLPELVDASTLVLGKSTQVVVIHQAGIAPEKTTSFAKELPMPSILGITGQEEEKSSAFFPAPSLPSFYDTPIVPLRAPITDDRQQNTNFIETSTLNPHYTFETYVPGPSNQMAFAACNAVAEQPGAQYSPLFLFGSVGLGKTHLLHAIGNTAKARHPNMRVVYMSAEQWVNAYIQAIRERKFDAFRNRFRSSCDILLIDDIQFLAGKDASQDEFFHTFNSLHQGHKQIVVTSDKYPHEIQGLEERLQTRLSWGLIADIRPPEIETRIAILYRKAESLKIRLPNDVAHYLASHVTSSVRELEGALVRLSAFAQVIKSELSLTQAKEYLSPVFRRGQGSLTPEKICEHVAAYYDLKPADLKGQSRQRQVALARQVAMALCRTHLSQSLPEIGRVFGGRDHTTVLSSLRKIDELRETDIGLQTVINRIEKGLLEDNLAN